MHVKTKLVATTLVIALVSSFLIAFAASAAARPAGVTLGAQNHLDAPWTAWYKDTRAIYGAEFHATAMCPDGNVVAVGTTAVAAPLAGDLIVGKFDQDGTMVPGWPKLFNTAGYKFNEGASVVVDASGNIIICGYTITSSAPNQWWFTVWKLNSAGSLLTGWPKFPLGNHAYGTGVALAPNGDIFCTGATVPPAGNALVLMRYHADGSPVAGVPKPYQVAGQPTFGYGILYDSDNNLVVAGFTEPAPGSHQAVLYKFDVNGNVPAGWPNVWDSGVGTYDDYFAISQDPGNGQYCVVGRTGGTTEFGGVNTDGKLCVTRYSKSGVPVAGWPKVYSQPAWRDNPVDVWRGAVDGSGCIAAATTCGADPSVHTVRYDRAGNMTESYPKVLSKAGYHNETRSCTVDSRGNVYTVGYSQSGADYSTFVAKYAPGPFLNYFAEGTTRKNTTDGNFEQWICLQNPGTIDANVTLTYMLADGTTKEQKVVVTKATRKTISVNDAIGDNQD
ncbi:MAG TPA: hypothetical protein VIK15_10330, partial [Candidatus Anoxymicrobiaceae bacterium]